MDIYGYLWIFATIFVAMLNTETIHITPEILSLNAQIDEFKGTGGALGTLAPERLLALPCGHHRKCRVIDAHRGQQAHQCRVDALLSNLKVKKFTTRDEQGGGPGLYRR